MQRDYLIYPSLIETQSGLIWSYDSSSELSIFDNNHPLEVSANKCNNSSFCLWYVSPLWQFNDLNNAKYALLGELDKWIVVSRQRFTSIITNTEKTQTIIALEGSSAEIVQLGIYHSVMNIINVKCFLSPTTGQAQLIITPLTITCSGMNISE